MKRLIRVILLFSFVFLTNNGWPADLYVDVSGNDSGDCTSNNDPCRSLQYAIDESHGGDVINVEAGIYFENIDFKGKAVKLRSVHGAKNTIIDGRDRTTVVKFNNDEGYTSVLDGFTIQNGYAHSGDCYVGGGITIEASNPTIVNCIIRWNAADTNGGGIWIFWSASPIIRNCEIVANAGGSGAGIYIQSFCSPTIRDSDINGNITAHGGGGIHCYQTNADLINVTITGNKANNWNGGGLSSLSSRINLTNCTISGNRSENYGGGIWVGKEAENILYIVNSILWNNTANRDGNEIYDADESDNKISLAFSDINQQWLHGIGNIRVDPKFRSPWGPESAPFSGGDYHLTAGSPCIDMGTSDQDTYPNLPDRDRDKDIRPLGSRHDMGSDEFNSSWQ